MNYTKRNCPTNKYNIELHQLTPAYNYYIKNGYIPTYNINDEGEYILDHKGEPIINKTNLYR